MLNRIRDYDFEKNLSYYILYKVKKSFMNFYELKALHSIERKE